MHPVLNQAPRHEVWGDEGTAPHILNLDGGEWTASRTGRLTLGARDPHTQ